MNHYKILIVDDLVENIQIIIAYLEEFHPEYRLYQATGGNDAIRLVETNSFNLIISDWDMPSISGIELIKSLKENKKTAHIPIIITTGVMLTSENLDTALKAGAYDFIRKPIDPVELSARTHSALMLADCHIKEIENKNKELVEKALLLINDSEFSLKIKEKLNQLLTISSENPDAKKNIDNIINKIDQKVNQDRWQSFNLDFKNVHSEFSKNLLTRFPDLTQAELKLSILIKLGISIKDTASLLYQSPGSVKVSRSRLRKKMHINADVSLDNFLTAL